MKLTLEQERAAQRQFEQENFDVFQYFMQQSKRALARECILLLIKLKQAEAGNGPNAKS